MDRTPIDTLAYTHSQAPQAKKPKTFTALDSSMRRANILKPQNAFEVKPDNSDNSPWKPLLTKKPHAVVPLDQSIVTFKNENGTIQYVIPTPFFTDSSCRKCRPLPPGR
jgi:exosome complex exonuclease RRP6